MVRTGITRQTTVYDTREVRTGILINNQPRHMFSAYLYGGMVRTGITRQTTVYNTRDDGTIFSAIIFRDGTTIAL
jgi:hypothetical protein